MRISLIIAAYNVENFIEKCVLSCCNQRLDKSLFEIVIVNDGSIDGTLLVLKRLKKKYENIIIVDQKNSGLGAARNAGIKQAKGDFVWFIDGDDYIEENILSGILNKVDKKNLDAVVLNYNVVDYQYINISAEANEVLMAKEIITGSEFYRDNYAKSYSCIFIFKKYLFNNFQVRFQERINMQDSEILPKLMLYIQRISFFNKICYYYVQHANSFTNSTNGEKRLKYFESIIEVNDSLEKFSQNEAKNDPKMQKGLECKLQGLHQIVFNHLVFFKYEKKWLMKIIDLLKENNFYPLIFPARGKMKTLKWGLNHYPYITKLLVDKIQDLRK